MSVGPDGRVRVRLERVSTAEALVRALTRQILDGSIEPGTWLRELDLAEKHGVSRQSLRAALVELTHLGLLQREPNRGVKVPVMTEDDIRDLYLVRGLIETAAARIVATRPASWPAMETVVKRLEQFPADASTHDLIEEDFAFHRAMVAGVGSPRLSRAHEMLCAEVRLSFVEGILDEGTSYLVGEHRELLHVFQQGDPDRAEARVREHLEAGLADSLARARARMRSVAPKDRHA
jgi:DNA-binding GntR family transcriptional regulator